jgi:hypothetical protein
MKKTQNAAADQVVALEQATIETLMEQVTILTNKVYDIEKKLEARDGPKSERAMTDDDARRILAFGDLEGASHKEAAEKLTLSYGQIYSCRKGFTFKHIHKEVEKILNDEKVTS